MIVFLASSCEDYLDINTNPNQPTVADVQLVLPQAIVASASVANTYNSYGGHFGGYIANAGGFSGFGNLFNYNLTPTDFQGLWTTTYQDPLQDLKYVIDKSEGIDALAYFNAAAKIMSVVNYQRLVDAYGNIPYSQALQAEAGVVTPAYDNAADVYTALIATLDEAISIIDDAQVPLRLSRATDPLFGSNTANERDIEDQMLDWKKYANTLKLRMLVRTSVTGTPAPGFATLDLALGFLDDDAIVDPGYEKNRPNPTWATWGKTVADALANSSRVPTTFSFSFYGGTAPKISDAGRGETIYVNYPTTPTNQLGNEVGNPFIVTGQVTWASNQAGLEGRGVLKGPSMGVPLMLAAEARFLLAEAQVRGYVTGGIAAAETSFNNGIKASFAYLYKDENEALKDTTGLVATYFANNAANDLVIFDLATTEPARIEAIITQKYIAMNMITSDESWNEYRRTGFPVSVPGGAPALDIASNKSNINTRPDRLPTRVMYPISEQSFNSPNYRVVDFTTERIFWDPN